MLPLKSLVVPSSLRLVIGPKKRRNCPVFFTVMNSDAFRELQASDLFRAVAQSQALSDAFLAEASHEQ